MSNKMTKHLEVPFDYNGITKNATVQIDRNGATITVEGSQAVFVQRSSVDELIRNWLEVRQQTI